MILSELCLEKTPAAQRFSAVRFSARLKSELLMQIWLQRVWRQEWKCSMAKGLKNSSRGPDRASLSGPGDEAILRARELAPGPSKKWAKNQLF